MKEDKLELDILQEVERLTGRVNTFMETKSKSVFERYQLTFALLVVFGVVAMSEGVKGIIENLGLAGHPVYMLIAGLVILIFTGTLY